MNLPGSIKTIIPSRSGSNRVPMKGMRLLGDKTLIEHTLDAVKGSRYLSDHICINSDGKEWAELAELLGVNFYHRRKELATSQSMIDDYLFDYIIHEPSDYLAVITPTAPFLRSSDIDAAVEHYFKTECNTLISAERIQTHCFYKGKSLNFSTSGQLPRSQDLEPVMALNFSIAIYDCTFFKSEYQKNGFAVLSGKIETFPLKDLATIDIDEEQDFVRAELALEFEKKLSTYQPRYSPLVKDRINSGNDTRT